MQSDSDGIAPAELIEIDLGSRSVKQGDRLVTLHDRAFDLLAVLAGDPDRVFASAELKEAVWPGRRIDDANLRMQVQALRKAFGLAAVVTVRQRGYMLGLTVRLRKPSRRGGNVPAWAGVLLGREADIAALQRLMSERRLVDIVGPAGIGKTRLAQHVAHLEASRHPGDAWWVDLATVPPGPEAVAPLAQTVARHLNLQTAPLVGRGAAGVLAAALSSWQALLLLDNAEHLADPGGPLAPFVRCLLETAPGLRLLITSQQSLRMPEEWVYRLGTLAVPPHGASVAEARTSPALRLLEDRARASHQGFALSDADLPLAGELLRRLDGIPLAIEMAAAQLPLLGLQALHAQLPGRSLLLDCAADAADGRHATLRAALDWSHGLLDDTERRVLHRLSVFAGAFDADSARQVATADGEQAGDTLHALLGLADKSLLQREPPARGGLPPRLRLLESTRLHADQALDRTSRHERGAAHRRHVLAMVQLARRACEHFYGASDEAWCERWLPDHDDLMLGFDRAHAGGDAESAAQIIELLVLGANITGRVEPALSRAAACGELAERASPLARARLLGWGSNLPRSDRSRVQAGLARVELWREVAGEEGRQGLCTSAAMLALACEDAGDRTAADAALAECRALESPAWPARLRRRCGWLALSHMTLLRDDGLLGHEGDAQTRLLAQDLARIGAWREWSIVQTHVAQRLRQAGRPGEAAALLRTISTQRLERGFDLDAGISLGMEGAALVEAAMQLDAAGQVQAAVAAQSEACRAAAEGLSRLAPLPALLRHFLEPLALLAVRLGDAAHGAVLLSAAERLRDQHRYGLDPMSARAAARARSEVGLRLRPVERGAAEARGRGLEAASLRLEALAWLRQAA